MRSDIFTLRVSKICARDARLEELEAEAKAGKRVCALTQILFRLASGHATAVEFRAEQASLNQVE